MASGLYLKSLAIWASGPQNREFRKSACGSAGAGADQTGAAGWKCQRRCWQAVLSFTAKIGAWTCLTKGSEIAFWSVCNRERAVLRQNAPRTCLVRRADLRRNLWGGSSQSPVSGVCSPGPGPRKCCQSWVSVLSGRYRKCLLFELSARAWKEKTGIAWPLLPGVKLHRDPDSTLTPNVC